MAVSNPGAAAGDLSKLRLEIPSGAIDGSNTTFNTSVAYESSSTELKLNGAALLKGVGNQYTEDGGTTLTTTEAPIVGDEITVLFKEA